MLNSDFTSQYAKAHAETHAKTHGKTAKIDAYHNPILFGQRN